MKSGQVLLLLLLVSECVHYVSMQSGSAESSDLAGAISYLADYVKAAIFHLSERITELHDITSSIREELGIIRKQLDEGTVQSSNEQTNVPILFPGNSPSSLQSAPVVFPEENSSPHPCGGVGVWHPVAYYNMSDTRYLCPAGWTLHQPPARGCGRTTHKGHTCDSAVFPVHSGPYTKICGRVVGYQFGHTVAFLESNEHTAITINDSYVTGVSITRGSPRQHIWTYAAGFYERALSTPYKLYCPCEEVVRTTFIPPFVGTQWYCESGDNEQLGTPGRNLFPDDPLWDGRGCHRTSKCCQFEGPVYFTTTLLGPTSDAIEARICNYHNALQSNVIVSQFELYVQ